MDSLARPAYELNQFDSAYSLTTPLPTIDPLPQEPQQQQQQQQQSLSPHSKFPNTNTNPTPTTQFTLLPTPLQDFRRNSYKDQTATSQPPPHPHSNTSSPMYSPPGLSVSTSASAVSEVVSPPATTLASPARRASTDAAYSSPLDGSTEWSHIAIPPLYPPTVQWPDHDFEDWDSLPELLRQEPRADFTPRRPMNAYFIYMRIRRAQFANANPHLSTGDLSKILGKEWGALPSDKKEPWSELYERLMRAFKKKYPDYQYERGGKRAKKRRSRSDPPPPAALRLIDIPRSAIVHSGVPHSALHSAHHSPRYLPYPHPGQGIFYAQQQQHLQQMQMQPPPPQQQSQQQQQQQSQPQQPLQPQQPQMVHYRSEPVPYSPTYLQPSYQPMFEPQPAAAVDPQQQAYLHQQPQYQWHQTEPLPAPTAGYPTEPTWDEYMH